MRKTNECHSQSVKSCTLSPLRLLPWRPMKPWCVTHQWCSYLCKLTEPESDVIRSAFVGSVEQYTAIRMASHIWSLHYSWLEQKDRFLPVSIHLKPVYDSNKSQAWQLIDNSGFNLLVSVLILIRRNNISRCGVWVLADITGIVFFLLLINWTIWCPGGLHLMGPFVSHVPVSTLFACSPQRLHGEGGGGIGQQPPEDAAWPRSSGPQRRLWPQRRLPGG